MIGSVGLKLHACSQKGLASRKLAPTGATFGPKNFADKETTIETTRLLLRRSFDRGRRPSLLIHPVLIFQRATLRIERLPLPAQFDS